VLATTYMGIHSHYEILQVVEVADVPMQNVATRGDCCRRWQREVLDGAWFGIYVSSIFLIISKAG